MRGKPERFSVSYQSLIIRNIGAWESITQFDFNAEGYVRQFSGAVGAPAFVDLNDLIGCLQLLSFIQRDMTSLAHYLEGHPVSQEQTCSEWI